MELPFREPFGAVWVLDQLYSDRRDTRGPPGGIVRKDEWNKESESNSDGTFNDKKLQKVS